jgi:hypothetical protein
VFAIGLLVLTLFSAWPRVTIASSDPLWLDELHTGWVIAGPWSEVSLRAAEGNQAPVFFWLTAVVVQLAGPSELSLRLISVVSGCLLIVTASIWVYYLTRSVLAGWLTAVLAACDETMIWYASEARPYSLLMLVGLCQLIAAWCSSRHLTDAGSDWNSAKDWWRSMRVHVPLILLSWGVVYIHYTGVLLLIAEVLLLTWWIMAKRVPFRSHAAGTVLALTLIIGFGLLPLIWQVSLVAGRRENWQAVASMEQLIRGLELPLLGWVLIPGSLLVLLQPETWRLKLASWLAGLVPILVFLLLAAAQVSSIAALALTRYFSVAMALPVVFAGLAVGVQSNRWIRWMLAAVLLGGSGIVHWNQSPWWRETVKQSEFVEMRQEGWQPAVETINAAQESADWPVVVFGGVIEDAEALTQTDDRFQQYLLFPVRSLYPIEDRLGDVSAGSTLGRPHFSGSQLEQMRQAGGGWLLIRHQRPIIEEIVQELAGQLSDSEAGPLSVDFMTQDPQQSDPVVLIAVRLDQQRTQPQAD